MESCWVACSNLVKKSVFCPGTETTKFPFTQSLTSGFGMSCTKYRHHLGHGLVNSSVARRLCGWSSSCSQRSPPTTRPHFPGSCSLGFEGSLGPFLRFVKLFLYQRSPIVPAVHRAAVAVSRDVEPFEGGHRPREIWQHRIDASPLQANVDMHFSQGPQIPKLCWIRDSPNHGPVIRTLQCSEVLIFIPAQTGRSGN